MCLGWGVELLLHIRRNQLRWFKHLTRMPPGWVLCEMCWAFQDRPRTLLERSYLCAGLGATWSHVVCDLLGHLLCYTLGSTVPENGAEVNTNVYSIAFNTKATVFIFKNVTTFIFPILLHLCRVIMHVCYIWSMLAQVSVTLKSVQVKCEVHQNNAVHGWLCVLMTWSDLR